MRPAACSSATHSLKLALHERVEACSSARQRCRARRRERGLRSAQPSAGYPSSSCATLRGSRSKRSTNSSYHDGNTAVHAMQQVDGLATAQALIADVARHIGEASVQSHRSRATDRCRANEPDRNRRAAARTICEWWSTYRNRSGRETRTPPARPAGRGHRAARCRPNFSTRPEISIAASIAASSNTPWHCRHYALEISLRGDPHSSVSAVSQLYGFVTPRFD